jgi:prolipoprotein diacylglyceryltransferase
VQLLANWFWLNNSNANGRGEWYNQEVFGKVTTLPWGIFIHNSTEKYHPLFAYESILLLVFWIGLRWAIVKHNVSIGKGNILALWLIAYGFIRFCLEYLRFSTAQLGLFSVHNGFR